MVETVANLSPPTPTLLTIAIPGNIAVDTKQVPFVSVVVQIRTGSAGRHGRGRFYLGAIDPGTWLYGVMTAGAQTGWVPSITALKAAYLGNPTSGMSLGLLRKGGDSSQFIPATDLIVRPVAGVQRRRNYGYGI